MYNQAMMPNYQAHGMYPHAASVPMPPNYPYNSMPMHQYLYNMQMQMQMRMESAYMAQLQSFGVGPMRRPKRNRTAYTSDQLDDLELAYQKSQYCVGNERKALAEKLALNEGQVKVWFQNRRTKSKRVDADDVVGDEFVNANDNDRESEEIDIEHD